MAMPRKVSDLEHLVKELERWYAHVRRMKRENFHATETFYTADTDVLPERHLGRRGQGRYTDLGRPEMGAAGARFSRNVSLENALPDPQLLSPDPRRISKELLERPDGGFQPADAINMLALAWIQFQVHDWFGHENDESEHRLPATEALPELRIKRTKTDTSRAASSPGVPAFINTQTHWWDGSQIYGTDEQTMLALRAKGENGLVKAELALEENEETGDYLLPYNKKRDAVGDELTGFNDNWWLGLSMMHTLFANEHNAICSELRRREPAFRNRQRSKERQQQLEDAVYDKARLVNTALMAKIHTTEWSPAVLDDPAIRVALLADWWGIPDRELLDCAGFLHENLSREGDQPIKKIVAELMSPTMEATGRLLHALALKLEPGAASNPGLLPGAQARMQEFIAGLVAVLAGRAPNRRENAWHEGFDQGYPEGAAYAMTEEFGAIYRMHALIPDTIDILPIGYLPDDTKKGRGFDSLPFVQAIGRGARKLMRKHGLATLVYSFAHFHPGKLRLKNYPQILRAVPTKHLPQETIQDELDIGAIDILRDRERGVPRYTRFRQHIRGDRIVTFEDLTGASEGGLDKEEMQERQRYADLLRDIYGNDVDAVDTMVGLFAETPREGFAFSETAFYVFALMAPLRLRCDRLFTRDYRRDVYTQTGIAWVNGNTMKTVLSRHLRGEIASAVTDVENVFAPWSADWNREKPHI